MVEDTKDMVLGRLQSSQTDTTSVRQHSVSSCNETLRSQGKASVVHACLFVFCLIFVLDCELWEGGVLGAPSLVPYGW